MLSSTVVRAHKQATTGRGSSTEKSGLNPAVGRPRGGPSLRRCGVPVGDETWARPVSVGRTPSPKHQAAGIFRDGFSNWGRRATHGSAPSNCAAT